MEFVLYTTSRRVVGSVVVEYSIRTANKTAESEAENLRTCTVSLCTSKTHETLHALCFPHTKLGTCTLFPGMNHFACFHNQCEERLSTAAKVAAEISRHTSTAVSQNLL